MKSVLLSIKPQWVEKIASGKKTIEVRKTRPTIDTPFKCYIYCTKDNDLWLTQKGVKRKTELSGYLLNGKVIGEFICDKIYKIKNYRSSFVVNNDIRLTERIARASCLYVDEMQKYLGEKDGYGWHISNLKIYDKPKELNEFKSIEKLYRVRKNTIGLKGGESLKRPPMSWCYIEV